MEGKEGKTEPATPKRRRERREKGELCVSSEIETVAVLLSGFLALRLAVPYVGAQLVRLLGEVNRLSVGANIVWDPACIQAWFKSGSFFLAATLAPIMIPVMLAAIIANVAQTGPYLSLKTLEPKWSAFNPVKGLQKIFSLNALYKLGMSLLKVLLITIILYIVLRRQIPALMSLAAWPIETFGVWMIRLLFLTALAVVLVFVVLAAVDYVYQHHNYEKTMMMTKKEVEDEHKSQESPVVVRNKQRQKMRELTLSRMMAAVPKASIVITNPTHVAVALQYDPEKMNAPVVVAKGLRLVAEKIKAIARENDVPILEKPEVARGLYKYVKVGHAIPSQFFGAVAEILAYLYKLGNQRIRRTVELGRMRDNTTISERAVGK